MIEGQADRDSITEKNLQSLSTDEQVLHDMRAHENTAAHCNTCPPHFAAAVLVCPVCQQ